MNENEFETVGEIVKKSPKRELLEWVLSIVIAVVLALIIRNFVFTVVKVEGTSMVPTLQNSDRLIVWRLGYKPSNGDIIVLHQKGEHPFIKRIIATEGQTVDINFNTHQVFVDGVELDEPYINQPTSETGDVTFPVTVPEDSVFVMGDNRNNSRDSRFLNVGMVAHEDIIGKAILRFFPFSSICTF